MTTTIHFVRHGKVYNPDHILYERLPGFPLSDLGMRMAQATGVYLAENEQTQAISAIYSSPLLRTRQTAGAVADALNEYREQHDLEPLTITFDERIIEAENNFRGTRIGFGDGALYKHGNWKLVRNLWRPSWGESYRQIASRMADFTASMLKKHAGEQIVAVSHESPIYSYRHLLETGHPEHNMLLRHTALASVTSITFDERGKLVAIAYADPAKDVQ